MLLQKVVSGLEADVVILRSDLSDRDGVIVNDYQAMRDQRERIACLDSHNFVLNHRAQASARSTPIHSGKYTPMQASLSKQACKLCQQR